MFNKIPFHQLLLSLADRNENLRSLYRDSLRNVSDPAIVRMTQSVIDQKESQSEKIRIAANSVRLISVDSPEMTQYPVAINNANELLELLIELETGMANTLEKLASVNEEKDEIFLNIEAAANMSVKFASWARDHRDLMTLF